MNRLHAILPACFLFSLTLAVPAEVVPNALFSEHCVLQQGQEVPVWGTADPGEAVTVQFRGSEVTATADETGNWRLKLATGDAGGPFEMSFSGSATDQPIELTDVVVGEVWIASGQSNMERQLGPRGGQKPIINGESEAARADYPTFRQFHVPYLYSTEPLSTLDGEWVVCTPESAIDFTAVGFFFGRDLQAALGVPIGLIHTSWGGTPAQAWTSEEGLAPFPEYLAAIQDNRKASRSGEGKKQNVLEANATWFTDNDPGTTDATPWQAPDLDDSDWPEMPVPALWEAHLGEVDGVVWLRKEFTLPADLKDTSATLNLGAIDDGDTTWINGIEVGSTFAYSENRIYSIPPGILRPGVNVLAVRVVDTGGGGGIWDSSRKPFIKVESATDTSLPLAGDWKYQISVNFREVRVKHPFYYRNNQNAPAVLFNAMLAPVIPYAIRGVIWYQGESNAGQSREYRDLFPVMIKDWRSRWGLGNFPFLFVQIAPYSNQPPEIREAQLLTLYRSPNTAMAVTIDVGDPEDIHPANKEPVGQRLALAARALAYGEDVPYSGPLFSSMSVRGNEAVLHFTHVSPGLVAGGGMPLRGFVIAGNDGIFHPGNARIEGDVVIVSSPEVEHPTAVRYGWQNVADGNLFNRAGLPASPFRTDVD